MLVISVYGVGMLLGICAAAVPIAAIIVFHMSVRDARVAMREAAAAAHRATATATATHSIAKATPEIKETSLESSGNNEPRYLFVVSARYGRSYEAVRARSGLEDDAPWITSIEQHLFMSFLCRQSLYAIMLCACFRVICTKHRGWFGGKDSAARRFGSLWGRAS
jgi:hypothetical protein